MCLGTQHISGYVVGSGEALLQQPQSVEALGSDYSGRYLIHMFTIIHHLDLKQWCAAQCMQLPV